MRNANKSYRAASALAAASSVWRLANASMQALNGIINSEGSSFACSFRRPSLLHSPRIPQAEAAGRPARRLVHHLSALAVVDALPRAAAACLAAACGGGAPGRVLEALCAVDANALAVVPPLYSRRGSELAHHEAAACGMPNRGASFPSPPHTEVHCTPSLSAHGC